MKKYPFSVFLTNFHGGKHVSDHSTYESAAKAVKKQKISDCICGCAYIALNFLPDNWYECNGGGYSDGSNVIFRMIG